MKVEITIPGRPITKKNSQVVVQAKTKEGKTYHRPIPSRQYQNYETECLWRLKTYRGPTFDGPVRVTCRYWLPNRRGWPDLMGLYQATADILEKARIIKNDRDIVSMDGSKIMGVDSENPRVEIVIKEVE